MGLKIRRNDPLTRDEPTRTKFSHFPPKSKYQTYTLFDIRVNSEQYLSNRQSERRALIQFPPEMDENWVRYGLAKLGQISKLPNWQKIVVLCVHNTTSALNS